jgi:hypothetical protein
MFKAKSAVFWDVMSGRLVGVYRCFGGAYCLHLQSQRVSKSRKQQKCCHFFLVGTFLGLLFDPEDRDRMLVQYCSGLLLDYTVLHPRR